MAETFKVGEVAIYCRPGSINYGAEVTIIGPLKRWRLWADENDYYVTEGYQVEGNLVRRMSRFNKAVAEPQHLRKKGAPLPPNRQETGEWDEGPWQPKHVTVSEKP